MSSSKLLNREKNGGQRNLEKISYWPCCINQSNSSIFILALWKPWYVRIGLAFRNYCCPFLDTSQAKFTI